MATTCSHLDQIRDVEPGEAWGWCYVDEQFVDLSNR